MWRNAGTGSGSVRELLSFDASKRAACEHELCFWVRRATRDEGLSWRREAGFGIWISSIQLILLDSAAQLSGIVTIARLLMAGLKSR